MPSLDLGPVVGPQGEQGATGAQGIRGEQGLPGPNQVTNSTATPLTGVLTGNGSVVGVASIDAAPTADSTGFAQSGGTDKAIKGRVPVYGMGKNLLRNACFVGGGTGRGVLPVNQRGQINYEASSVSHYSIDGWQDNRISVSLPSDDGITLSSGISGYDTGYLKQYLSIDLIGQEVAISALIRIGNTLTLVTRSGVLAEGVMLESDVTSYFKLSLRQLSASAAGEFFLWKMSANETVKVVAAKLELGSEQTLCHNEGTAESPVWVLNEVPDYEYELYRCMTSTADSSDAYASKTLATEQELAYVENGTTATKTNGYAVGEYFCWHGLLYRAKTAIGNGDTFTENSNCELVTEGGLNNVGSIDISSYISVNQSRLNNAKIKARYYPGSKKVELQAEGAVSTSLSAGQNTLLTVASPYAPSSGVQQFTGCGIKNSQTPIAVWASSAAINVQHGGASAGDAIAISLSWLLV